MAEPASELASPLGWRDAAVRAGLVGVRASLLLSPRPKGWVIRQLFVQSAKQIAATLDKEPPGNVATLVDERYGDSPQARFDVYTPFAAGSPLPAVVWVHGGAFVGGSKDEIGGYLRMIAGGGAHPSGGRYPQRRQGARTCDGFGVLPVAPVDWPPIGAAQGVVQVASGRSPARRNAGTVPRGRGSGRRR